MSRNKMIRTTMGGILLVVALAAGVSVYDIQKNKAASEDTLTAQNTDPSVIEKKILTMPETETNVSADKKNTDADPTQATDKQEIQTVETSAGEVKAQTESKENTSDNQIKETSAGVSQVFTENSVIDWTVQGKILLDYSMDETTYFSTLNVYKCNPAVLLKAEADTPVHAAYAGTVKDIFTSAETGDTVIVDMGNGYEATYGQLKEITVSKGDTIQKGMQIGNVCEPTKYYKNEGTNLYFAMTKDNEPVDPAIYTESLTE